MERDLPVVPNKMLPPSPPPAASCSVVEEIRELPEKVIARSRGVLALSLMLPPLPAPVVVEKSWEPAARLRTPASIESRPPLPAAVVSVATLALSVMVMLEPKSETWPPLPTPLVWVVMRVVAVGSVLSPLMVRV